MQVNTADTLVVGNGRECHRIFRRGNGIRSMEEAGDVFLTRVGLDRIIDGTTSLSAFLTGGSVASWVVISFRPTTNGADGGASAIAYDCLQRNVGRRTVSSGVPFL